VLTIPFIVTITVTFCLSSRCLIVIFFTLQLSVLRNFLYFTTPFYLLLDYLLFASSLNLFTSHISQLRGFLYFTTLFLFAALPSPKCLVPYFIGVDHLCVRCLFQLHWTSAHLLQLILDQLRGRVVPIEFQPTPIHQGGKYFST
jgi:hypothetical protein